MPRPSRRTALRALAALLLGTLPVLPGCGDAPVGRLYLGSGLTDQVFVLDPRNGALLDTLTLDARPGEMDEPHGLAVAPDGRHWYATLSHGEPTLWKFESAGDRLVGRLALGVPGAARIGITPDGSRAFIPDYWRTGQGAPSSVAVVELEDLRLVATPTLCPAPHDAEVDPEGIRVAVTCSLGDEVVVLDAHSLDVLARFPTREDPGPPGNPLDKPLNVVWSGDGSRLFVSLTLGGAVAAFTPQGQPLGRVAVGGGPTQLARRSRDGALVVVNRGDGSLSVVDGTSLTELSRIPLEAAPFPHGVALNHDGRIAYVSYEGTVEGPGGAVAVELDSGRVLWRTSAGSYTLGVALLEGG